PRHSMPGAMVLRRNPAGEISSSLVQDADSIFSATVVTQAGRSVVLPAEKRSSFLGRMSDCDHERTLDTSMSAAWSMDCLFYRALQYRPASRALGARAG